LAHSLRFVAKSGIKLQGFVLDDEFETNGQYQDSLIFMKGRKFAIHFKKTVIHEIENVTPYYGVVPFNNAAFQLLKSCFISDEQLGG
jgi:hypothetical protein